MLPALKYLDFSNYDGPEDRDGNTVTAVDLSHNPLLEGLGCGKNGVSQLDLSVVPGLMGLDCGGNNLQALDVSMLTNLRSLYCWGNQITSLNLKQNPLLEEIEISGNAIGEIDTSIYEALRRLGVNDCGLKTLDLSKNNALTYLDCGNNEIQTIDVSDKTDLEYFNCSQNKISSLNVSNNSKLIELRCYETDKDTWENRIKVLDVANKPELRVLECWGNPVAELDVTGSPLLEYFNMAGTQVKTIDLTNNTILKGLWCNDSFLEALDVSSCPELDTLDCTRNNISSLNVANNPDLGRLWCGYNNLNALDLSNNEKLVHLDARSNQIIALNIEGCTQLEAVKVRNNKLMTLDVSGRTNLRELQCQYNQITSLNIDGCYALEHLNCRDNKIQALDVSKRTQLKYLWASNNDFSSLNFDGCTLLEGLGFSYAHFISSGTIDLSQFTNLNELWCASNGLNAVDVSKMPNLKILGAAGNNFTAINLANNPELVRLEIHENPITTLDVSQNTKLVYLNCRNTNITALDVSHNPLLEELYCRETGLTQIDVSKNTNLKSLSCWNNNITALDLSANGALTELYCDGNQLTILDLSANSQLVSVDCNKNNLVWLNIDNCGELVYLNCTNNNIPKLYIGGCPKLVNFKHDASTEIVASHVDNPIDNETSGVKPSILTKTLNPVRAGVNYSVQLIASGTTPITWSLAKGSKLPAGFTLSESGLLTGSTNAKLSAKKFTVTATNSAGEDSAQLTLSALILPEISTASLKDATIAKSYSVTMKTRRGTKQYNGTKYFGWKAEGLPEGLTLNEKTGRISGKPTVAGTFSVEFTVKNDAGEDSKTLGLTVKGIAPTLSGSFARAELNKAYSSGLKLSKGSQPVAWSIEGDLPDGLTLDPNTGIIYGTPASYGKNGSFKFKITATNSAGSKTKSITFRVKGVAPKIKTKKLDEATAGQAYSMTLETSAGSEPIEWSATGLPDGLDVVDGVITGTPSTEGSYKVTITATNPVKSVSKKNLTLKVNKAAENTDIPAVNDDGDVSLHSDNGGGSYVPQTTNEDTGHATDDKYSYSESYVIVAELGVISSDVEGLHEFGIALPDYVPEGSELVYIANSDSPSDDDEIAEFYDDEGNEISGVPESRKITISIWLNPERIYNPAIGIKR